jgi:hypothetical protein
MGVDAGVSGDAFAVVIATRHPHHHDRAAERYTQVWNPPKGGKIDFEIPKAEIKRLCQEYKIVEVAYDEFQTHDMMNKFRQERVAARKGSQLPGIRAREPKACG